MPVLFVLKTFVPASGYPTSANPENSGSHNIVVIAPTAQLLLIETHDDSKNPIADNPSFPKNSIPFSMPLFNALQNPTIPKDSIENTLYANIKLKKILDDYILVQKKAQDILKEISTADTTPAMLANTQINELPQILTSSLMEFRDLVKYISKELKTADEIANKSPVATGSIPVGSGKQLASADFSNPSFKNPYFRDALPLIPTETNNNNKIERRANSSLFYDDIELPWIIKAPLRALSYMMAHALESAIFGIGVIVVISIFSSLRSSKQ
nr:hypothetical protein [Desulfobulbaceae bacterium]